MKVATFNICGWKSAIRKGLLRWVKKEGIDILGIQELRAGSITKPLNSLIKDYNFCFNPSRFHGTAVITKEKPIRITKKVGHERFDKEGRFLQLEYDNFLMPICRMEGETSFFFPIS